MYGSTTKTDVVRHQPSNLSFKWLNGVAGHEFGANFQKESNNTLKSRRRKLNAVTKKSIDDFFSLCEKYEIPESDVVIDYNKILGTGIFSHVFQGTFRGTPCVVKSVMPGSDIARFLNFLNHVEITVVLGDHKNIVQLLGVVTDPLKMNLYPCKYGTLDEFLDRQRSRFVEFQQKYKKSETCSRYVRIEQLNNEPPLTTLTLVKFAKDVAEGMSFLASKKIVHGCLVTWAIFIHDDSTAKISNFYSSRQLADGESVYRFDSKRESVFLPWRFESLETTKNCEISTKSDVWTFGLCLWYMFNLGERPFYEIDRSKLDKPEYASNEIYATMLSCWNTDPDDRPTFDQLQYFFSILWVSNHAMETVVKDIEKVPKTTTETFLLAEDEVTEFFEGNLKYVTSQNLKLEGENVQYLPFKKEFDVLESDIHLGEYKLGSGKFGDVFRGELRGRPVAIKKPKSLQNFRSFLKEIKILTFIGRHEHIVEFLGAVTQNIRQGIAFVVVELAPHGSLEATLPLLNLAKQENLAEESTKGSTVSKYKPLLSLQFGFVPALTEKLLARWCLEIADGMSHLASKKVVHGDLAARNVLLFNDYVAKITDFGQAKHLYADQVYTKGVDVYLPYQWMAIESLKTRSFSCQSDIWSFGVTAYEIFSLGGVPFENECWASLLEKLEAGLTMDRPTEATDEIYESMLKCCHLDPSQRPSFNQLKQFYKNLLSTSST